MATYKGKLAPLGCKRVSYNSPTFSFHARFLSKNDWFLAIFYNDFLAPRKILGSLA